MALFKSVLLRVVVLFVSGVFADSYATGVFTLINIPDSASNRASFFIADYPIPKLSSLRFPGPYQHDVVFTRFTPIVSGLYTLGVSNASWDAVMIVYQGQSSFPSNAPSLGAISLIDDGYLTIFQGLPIVNPEDATLNPVIQNISLKANTNYMIALTPFTAGRWPSLPVELFVYGDERVILEAAAAMPEPASGVAIAGTFALAAVCLRRRKRAA